MFEILSVLLFLLLATAISYFGYRVYTKPSRMIDRLAGDSSATSDDTAAAQYEPVRGGAIRIITAIGEKVPLSPAEAGVVRRYLIAAGLRSESAVAVFYGAKVTAAVCLLLIGILAGPQITSVPFLRILIDAAAAAGGWFLPTLIVDHRVSRRRENIHLSLPDALDLMVVCVEAGHGLDQAFARVSRELARAHKDLCEEFNLVNMEMRAGKRRNEALHNLADRTGETELRNLVSILIQADRFGTGITESLRTHADFMRIQRRQEAEERAGKVGVKLVFPIFFCILPAMFIITAGPAMLSIVKTLLPMMDQFK